jgi:hypothetical protein
MSKRVAKGGEGDTIVPLRITLVDPPASVTFALQRGKGDLEQATRSNGAAISFQFTARVKSAGARVNLLGPHCQGPPASRFVYVNSGTLAGDPKSPWTRRAKVPLTTISAAMIAKVARMPGGLLEARIAGTARDGGPAAASVPLLGDGWQVTRT